MNNILPLSKPRALVICHPFEPRICYFLAGLSHYYQLDVVFKPNPPYFKASEVFYKWLFAGDAAFRLWQGEQSVLQTTTYEATFVHADFFGSFSQKKTVYKTKGELLELLKKLRGKTRKLFFLEPAEFYFFNFTAPEFWQMVDGVLKWYLFKKQYAYLIREEAALKNARFGGAIEGDNELWELNAKFEAENYYHKIYPMAFPGSIVDRPKRAKPLKNRDFDLAASFRKIQTARTALARAVEDRIKNLQFNYSLDYGEAYSCSRLTAKNFFLPSLVKFHAAERAVSRLFYGKYPYVHLAYVHNLKNSRCFLGLGHINRSLRSADVWAYGAVLLDWSYEKMDCGVPMVDGYNYFSIGEREEIFPDNLGFGPGQKEKTLSRIETILSDSQKQEEIVQNQFLVYQKYFSSPAEYVKKLFIEKALPELARA